MTSQDITVTMLVPDEGKYLTQTADVDIRERIIADRIALGSNDAPGNWREITSEEAAEYTAQRQQAEKEDADKASVQNSPSSESDPAPAAG